MKSSRTMSSLLQEFFTEYLINQRRASQHTIASYRDSFCLLLKYAQQRLKKFPVVLEFCDLNARFISDFLNHLEKDRGVSARSRNQRLAAIHSFFRYISLYTITGQFLVILTRFFATEFTEDGAAALEFLFLGFSLCALWLIFFGCGRRLRYVSCLGSFGNLCSHVHHNYVGQLVGGSTSFEPGLPVTQ